MGQSRNENHEDKSQNGKAGTFKDAAILHFPGLGSQPVSLAAWFPHARRSHETKSTSPAGLDLEDVITCLIYSAYFTELSWQFQLWKPPQWPQRQ
jgi:hypothetical protein